MYRVAEKESAKIIDTPKPKQKKFFLASMWFLVIIVIILANILFTGKLTASYILNNVDPYSFFKDGKYLILFQNNSELRGSGGFIGSFAVLSMQDYEVKNLSFETNIYKLDSAFAKTDYVKAPAPLADFIKGKSWTLRDSNYDLSFPEAAADIGSFYQKETGDSVDGIITVNASLVRDLLKITGPIGMPKYNTTITADNFFTETQTQIEKNYYQNPENTIQNEPKTIIKDLYPEVISRALKQNKISLIEFVLARLKSKDIQLYFKNQTAENIVLEKGWGGEVKSDSDLQKIFGRTPDYLNINVSNFGGNKSSLSVSSDIQYQTDADGAAELSVTRTHRGSEVWPDGTNNSYLRILVPQGSTLQSANLNGRDIKNSIDTTIEADKTAFGTTVVVGPGQAAVLKLNYQLPLEIDNRDIAVQKQSGTEGDIWEIIYTDKVLFSGKLNHDLYLE